MLRFYKYSNPFKTPFKTALGSFETREGIILCYSADEIQAFGEVAPLPGFSKEYLSEVEQAIIESRALISDSITAEAFDSLIFKLKDKYSFPSLNFGIDTLIHDLKAKRMGVPIQELLFGKVDTNVQSNASVGIRSLEETIDQARLKVDQGFGTIKIKVGSDFEKEQLALSSLRQTLPEIKLRIDANQAWNKENAVVYLNRLSEFGIEYCEQPVASSSLNDMKWVKDRSPIKIAADESLTDEDQRNTIIENGCCDLLIIKPALIGSFGEINVTKQLADSHGMVVVFTTTLDGIIGRKITAVLASGLGSRKFAHGLGTGSFFNEPYSSGEQIRDGYFQLSAVEPGLGHPVDLSFLKEIR